MLEKYVPGHEHWDMRSDTIYRAFFDRENPGVIAWDTFADEGTLGYAAMGQVVRGILRKEFVYKTIKGQDPEFDEHIDYLETELSQQGRKFGIFKVRPGNIAYLYDPFILVTSRGSEKLNQEVRDDFANLKNLRAELVKRGLPAFVPQVYALGTKNGVPGFSMEYLKDHTELNWFFSPEFKGIFADSGVYYPEFTMNGKTEVAKDYNETRYTVFKKTYGGDVFFGPRVTPDDILPVLHSSDFHQKNQRLKQELVAHLYVVNHVTGAIPREFAVNSGDFMVDPTKENFDLRLITIRGGWAPLSPEDFMNWAVTHKDVNPDGIEDRPLLDEESVRIGIEKGRAMLAQAA